MLVMQQSRELKCMFCSDCFGGSHWMNEVTKPMLDGIELALIRPISNELKAGVLSTFSGRT